MTAAIPNTQTQTPLFLLSNISNYVTVKLDHTNYLMWKFQITGILDAYSLLDHLEEPTPCPSQFILGHCDQDLEVPEVNPLYLQWKTRDKTLFSLISSTLSPSAISLVMGQTTASGIWRVILNRYTSISRSSVVNLKRELHSIKKNSDSVTQYLQKIKEARDKLVSVGVFIDDEEILHIVLQGLPSDFHSFTSAMLTKNEAVKFEELHTLMQTEEGLLKSSMDNSKEIAHMAMVAMASEFGALQRQHTWSLVPPCSDQNLVGCRWVYKIKRNADGSVARYKARLVAKGFHQKAGVDFDETFSPVVKPPTVRIILSLAAQNHWPLRQLDVSNVFLHGLLKETVYMAQPLGFIDSAHPSQVCKLHKSLYGLKQALRAWFERFTSHLLTLGFTASLADASLFVLHHGSTTVYLLLYVDDIIITSNNSTAISDIVSQLSVVFELKDLGLLHYFLGLQIDYKKVGLFVHQHKYVSDLLHKFQMTDCKAAPTPIATTPPLSTDHDDALSDPTPFRSLVGALQNATFTRPDIAFAVNRVCQFMHKPSTIHFVAAKRILRYLKGTLHKGIFFQPRPLALTAFTDVDWAGDPSDRRSTSGIMVFLGHNPITWLAKKQHTISRSSTEAEYRSLAIGAAELAWLRQVLCDLKLFLPSAPLIWCDNTSALALASNPVFHGRTKHIEVDYHFVRENVVRGDLLLQFISTHDQLADIFTKALPSTRFLQLCSKLMVCSTDHQFEGG
jgi:hypothetical protein